MFLVHVPIVVVNTRKVFDRQMVSRVTGVDEKCDQCDLDEKYVTHQLKSSEEGEEWHENLLIDDSTPIRFKLDSGATYNVLPLEAFRRVQRSVVLSAGPRVRNYGAKSGYFKVMGVFMGSVTIRGVQYPVKFVVVDEPGQPPILGLLSPTVLPSQAGL